MAQQSLYRVDLLVGGAAAYTKHINILRAWNLAITYA